MSLQIIKLVIVNKSIILIIYIKLKNIKLNNILRQ